MALSVFKSFYFKTIRAKSPLPEWLGFRKKAQLERLIF